MSAECRANQFNDRMQSTSTCWMTVGQRLHGGGSVLTNKCGYWLKRRNHAEKVRISNKFRLLLYMYVADATSLCIEIIQMLYSITHHASSKS